MDMFLVSGFFAVHENMFATQGSWKKCEEMGVYGKDMEKEAGLWWVPVKDEFSEKTVGA